MIVAVVYVHLYKYCQGWSQLVTGRELRELQDCFTLQIQLRGMNAST